MAVTTVPVGHTGILLTFGRVQENALNEGLHLRIPFVQQIVYMDNRVQLLEVETQAFSIDIQTVSARIAVNYQLKRDYTFEVYRSVGVAFERKVIEPAVHEVLKSVSAQYTAEELISMRALVSNEIMISLNEEMLKSGITVTAMNIIDFDFTEDFIKAVEDKQIAEQRQRQAEIDNITMVARASAEAESLVIAAEGISESYRLQNMYLTELIIMLEWVNKWNGELPMVQSGNGMFLDVGDLMMSGN
jgi:regulator of protease activity HflC (stomatin/prohibitin superfamily)